MNKKHLKTYNQIFMTPTKSDIKYTDVKALLESEGANYKKGKGSRRKFFFKQQILHIHEPHPQKILPKYAVEAIREFLKNTGVKP